jgi:ribosome-binding factor A
MTSYRLQRIAELMQEELGLLITSELDDPRLEDALVTVTGVEVSPDMQNIRVFVDHALEDSADRQVLEALRHAEPFLRHALVEHVDPRVAPHLTFRIDDTARRARRIDALLEELAAQPPSTATDEQPQAADDSNPAA